MRKTLLIGFVFLTFSLSMAQIEGFKSAPKRFEMPASVRDSDYLHQNVVFKLRPSSASLIEGNTINHSDLISLLKIIDGTLIRKFPNHHPFINSRSKVVNPMEGQPLVDLSLIFQIEYKSSHSIAQIINQLYGFGIVEYAEPIYLPRLCTNDPNFTDQYYLQLLQTPNAWWIQDSDTNIVIGIVDTGVEITHPDLIANIKYNYADPIDGNDNDGDGKIDNFYGWDLGENDNNPTPTAGGHHGTWVSGCAAAVHDNGIGGAGVGNTTKILPIKITNSAGYLTAAYDGIVYAADHGCKVINTSWGSPGAYSMYNQEIVNYAVVNKGCVLVAAAGNDNNEGLYYPASYENVISVGGSDKLDQKWYVSNVKGSNYNDYIDVVAPAQAIYTTYQNGTFINIGGGTSFASPMVAATAALVLAKYPSYSPQQVAAIIKMTATDIYSISYNQPYKGKLGTGRVSTLNAVTAMTEAYIAPYKIRTNSTSFSSGDTSVFYIDLINYLSVSNAIDVTISTTNPDVTILDSMATYGWIGSLEIKQSSDNFKILVNPSASVNERISVMVIATDGIHKWKEMIDFFVNKDYVDVHVNQISTSITSYGMLGYNFSMMGEGFKYKNSSSSIFEMGLIVAQDSTIISTARETDFYSPFNLKSTTSGESDLDVEGTFDDAFNSSNVNVDVKIKSMAWSSSGNDKYVMVDYCFKNKNNTDINNAYIGLYTDFDIIDRNKNLANYNSAKKIGYAYKDNGDYFGVQLLSNETPFYYAFNTDGRNNSIATVDGFSNGEQWNSMSKGVSRSSADLGDVSTIIGAGPLNIKAGDSLWITFALLAGDNLNDLLTSATNANNKYKEIRGIQLSLQNLTEISCNGAADGEIEMAVNSLGGTYTTSWTNNNDTTPKISGLGPNMYQIKVKNKRNLEAYQSFTISEPPLLTASLTKQKDVLCYGTKTGAVNLTVGGGTPNYYYNWNNPAITGVANPSLPAGTHHLTVTDVNGCTAEDTITITQPSALKATCFCINDTTGECIGVAGVHAQGGSGSLSYLWNDANAQISDSATGLCEGSYSVIITDINNCKVSKVMTITGKPASNNGNAIDEINSDLFKLTAFPNPAATYFILEFEIDKQASINLSLYDEQGRLSKSILNGEYKQGAYKVVVCSNDLANGYYYYKLLSNNNSASGKVTVIN